MSDMSDISDMTSLTVQVPLSIRRRVGRKTVVTPEAKASAAMPAPAIPTRADPALLKALARAFRYQRMLDEGQYASITEMAEAEKLDRGYMGRLLQLTLLAPDIVQAILDGRPVPELGLPTLLHPLPLEWSEQQQALLGRDRPHLRT
ncbi:MAG TPA: hypothetical protein VIL69_22080 [Roseomonas sp.]|jgi:hypothetical protein